MPSDSIDHGRSAYRVQDGVGISKPPASIVPSALAIIPDRCSEADIRHIAGQKVAGSRANPCACREIGRHDRVKLLVGKRLRDVVNADIGVRKCRPALDDNAVPASVIDASRCRGIEPPPNRAAGVATHENVNVAARGLIDPTN